MIRKLTILIAVLLLVSVQAVADYWVSVGIPTIYRFARAENSSLSPDSELKGTPSGYMIYGSIYEKPFLGVENYQIALNVDNSDEVPAIIEVQFYDIGMQFEQRYTSFLVGYGYGSIKTECQSDTCSTWEFGEGIARQYFVQFAVNIYEKLALHLSAHRVMGENSMETDTSDSQLVLDGTLYAFGLKLAWR